MRASGLPYTIVRPGWFDYNAPDEHRLVLLQGDTRQAGDPSDGVVARRQIAEVLVRSLSSDRCAAQDLRARRHARPGTERLRRAVRPARRGPAGRAGRRARHGEHAAGGGAAAGARRPGCGARALDVAAAGAPSAQHTSNERNSHERRDRRHRSRVRSVKRSRGGSASASTSCWPTCARRTPTRRRRSWGTPDTR